MTYAAPNWSAEQARWQNRYADSLTRQVTRLTTLVREQRNASRHLSEHFESMVQVFQQGLSHPGRETRQMLITLIRELHPLPLWWGKWSDWFRVVEQSIQLAAALGDLYHQAWFTVSLAEMMLTAGHAARAKTLLAEAKIIAAEHAFADLAVQCALIEFEALKYLGELPDRNRALDELENMIEPQIPRLKIHEQASTRVVLLLKKSDLLRRQSQLDEGLRFTNQAFDIIREHRLDDPDLLGEAYMRRSAAYWSLGEYPSAIHDLETASGMFGRVGNPISQGECLGDLGLVYWSAARYHDAEKALQKSLQLTEQVKSLWSQAIRTGDLGLVNLSRGRLDLAGKLLNQHEELALLTNNHAEARRANGNIGLLKVVTGDFEIAIQRLGVSLEFSIENKLFSSQGIIYANLAWAYDGVGEHEKALSTAREGLHIAEQINAPEIKLIALRSLGELQTNPAERARYTEEALAIARQRSQRLNEAACLLTLADCRKNGSLYNEAVDLLHQIGAHHWLETQPVFNNLRLPLLP